MVTDSSMCLTCLTVSATALSAGSLALIALIYLSASLFNLFAPLVAAAMGLTFAGDDVKLGTVGVVAPAGTAVGLLKEVVVLP